MSTGVAAGTRGARTPSLALVAVVAIALAFGAAFAVAKLTQDEAAGGAAPQAAPIEPSTSSPKLPSAPPAASLPDLKPAPAPAPQGGGTAPPAGAPAPTPAPAPAPGGGGGGTIIEG